MDLYKQLGFSARISGIKLSCKFTETRGSDSQTLYFHVGLEGVEGFAVINSSVLPPIDQPTGQWLIEGTRSARANQTSWGINLELT